MKLVKKSEAKEFKNSNFCVAYEYQVGDKAINAAVIKLSGRYPDTGRVVNNVCKELVYVIVGNGDLNVYNKLIKLEQGDQALIEVGEKYYFDGKMTFITSCSPAWYPKQHIRVD